LVALAFIVGSKRSEITVTTDYRAKNAILERQVDSLRAVLQLYRQNEAVHIKEADSLNALIDRNSHKIKENEKKREKDLGAIRLMPADSSYRFFTGYIRQYAR
jgi:hypothetical protein